MHTHAFKARGRTQIPWSWNYRHCESSDMELGTGLGTFAKAILTVSHLSPQPQIGLLPHTLANFFIGLLTQQVLTCSINQVFETSSRDGPWKVSLWMSGFEKLAYLPGLQLKQPSKRNYGRGNNLELSVLLYKIEYFGWLGQGEWGGYNSQRDTI